VRPLRAAGDAALVGDRNEELEIDEIEAQVASSKLSFRLLRRLSP
jgi:hypothetical protein